MAAEGDSRLDRARPAPACPNRRNPAGLAPGILSLGPSRVRVRGSRASGAGLLLRQAAKRQRAQPSESGCDRDVLEDPVFAAEAGLTFDRGADEKETTGPHRARSRGVGGPG